MELPLRAVTLGVGVRGALACSALIGVLERRGDRDAVFERRTGGADEQAQSHPHSAAIAAWAWEIRERRESLLEPGKG